VKGDNLDRAVEIVLTAGLAAGALLLFTGLVTGGQGLLTIGMFVRRDVLFGFISLWILVVLATSIGVALHG
jgi:hypothetical protein